MSKMERVDSRSATSAPDDVTMPAIARAAKQAVRDEAPEVPPIAPAARTLGVTSQEEPANKTAPRSPRRHWVRGALFALLPLALIAGAYWYVTGGRVMSTDDAYVEADKVGISTDVSGIVTEIGVSNNQVVAEGQVLFRMDDLPFRLALERARTRSRS
jgi:membrane fusion protein, multidrug efflux system